MPKFIKREVQENFVKSFEIKKAENQDDIYQIEGIASVTGVIDKTGELIEDGAFDESIGNTVSIMVMHEGLRKIIGSAKLSLEDKKLMMKGKLYEDVELARAIAKNKADGVKFNLSIGGKRDEWFWREEESGDYIIVAKKVSVREVSITGEGQQAHQDAIVTKTLEGENEMPLQKDGLTKEDLQKVITETITKANEAKSSGTMEKALGELRELKKSIDGMGEDGKVAELEKTITTMNETMEKMEKMFQDSQDVVIGGSIEKKYDLQKDAFEKYLRTEDKQEAKEILKAINTDVSSGGNLIPELVAKDIVKEITESTDFMKYAKIYKGTSGDININVRVKGVNSVQGIAEGAGNTIEGNPTYPRINIGAGKIQSVTGITDEMRDDSGFDVIGEVKEIAVEDFSEYIATKTVGGVLTATQLYEGFTKNSDVIAGAIETKTASVMAYDDLMNLQMSLKPKVRRKGSYFASTDAVLKMKTMKDGTGRPIWLESLIPNTPSTFNGFKVIEVVEMDEVADGNYPVLFADFKEFYAMYIRKNLETEVERNGKEGINEYIIRMRAGGKVRKATSGALLKIKSA